MVTRRFLPDVESVAKAVRDGRAERGITQVELARRAGVGRRFVVDLESGHPRAELAKVLDVLAALDIHALAVPSVPSGMSLEDVDMDAAMARFTTERRQRG